MKKLLVIFIMMMTVTGFAQTNQNGQPVAKVVSSDDRLTVIGESIIEVPASNVKFTVTFNTTDKLSMNDSYTKHRESEDKLVKLFKKFNIPDKNINYSLPSLSYTAETTTNVQGRIVENPPQYNVQQQVTFIIDSIDETTTIEELLITDGFTNFRSEFLLENLDFYKGDAVVKAVFNAKQKASRLAMLADRKIKRTIKITTLEENRGGGMALSVASYNSGSSMESLTEISQTVKITKRVSVDFELE